jgi:hypothetical protein
VVQTSQPVLFGPDAMVRLPPPPPHASLPPAPPLMRTPLCAQVLISCLMLTQFSFRRGAGLLGAGVLAVVRAAGGATATAAAAEEDAHVRSFFESTSPQQVSTSPRACTLVDVWCACLPLGATIGPRLE